jgi:phospholipid/cholesterol/gamma-HCH transport system substrate-binding protein
MTLRRQRARRAAGLVLFVAFGLGVAVYLLGRVGTTLLPQSKQFRFEADVQSAIALASAADIREAGVFIGRVTGIKRAGTITALELSIDAKYGPVYRDATVQIRAKSVAGENYVQLDPGTPRAGRLPQAGVLPVSQERQAVQDDDVFSIFGAAQRRALESGLVGLGGGLAGQGGDNLNHTLEGMTAVVDKGQGFSRILSEERTQTAQLLNAFDTVASALGQRAQDIQTLTRTALTTASAVTTRDAELRATLAALPAFLRQSQVTANRLGSFSTDATPVMANLRIAAENLVPAVQALRPAAGEATTTLATLDRFATIARPTFERLAPFATQTAHFLGPYGDFLRQLNPLVAYLQPYWREVSSWFADDGAAVNATDPVSHLARVTLPISRSNFPTIIQGPLAQILSHLSGGLDTRGTNAHPAPGSSAQPQPSAGAVPPIQPDPPYQLKRTAK